MSQNDDNDVSIDCPTRKKEGEQTIELGYAGVRFSNLWLTFSK